MSTPIMFVTALREGIIKKGDYFKTTSPKYKQVTLTERETGFGKRQFFEISEGEEQYWRLEEGLKLWGDPTKEKLTLCGKKGGMKGPDAMHRLMRELYDFPDAFSEVRACGFDKTEFIFDSISAEELVLINGLGIHQHPDDKEMSYWLATRYISTMRDCVSTTKYICMYIASNLGCAGVISESLHVSSNGRTKRSNHYSYKVRPKAIPRANLFLTTEGCDGTRKHPYEILNE